MGNFEKTAAGPSKRFLVLSKQWQLLLELCHFTQDLNPLWQTKILQKRLKVFSESALSQLFPNSSDDDKFEAAQHFFFNEMGFKISPPAELSLQNCFLPYVLSSKRGPAPVLMLLFCSLLEEFGLKVQVSSSRKKYLLKIQLNEKAHIINFEEQGRRIEPYEIVELINRGFDFSNGSLDTNILIVEYLEILKKLARKENKLQILSMTHSYLMKYQPFNLRHISERAIVAYETGDYRMAVDDIRNYFQYKQKDFTNTNLKKIYKTALKREKHKSLS